MNIVGILYNKIYCRNTLTNEAQSSHKCSYSDLVNLWW